MIRKPATLKSALVWHGPVFLAFGAVTVLLHWQLAAHISTHFFGRSFEDVLEAHFLLAWARSVVFEGAGNPLYNPNIFYPQGWYVASGAQPIWYFLALAPLTRLVGEIAAYNLAVLGLLIAASFGVYLLAYQFAGGRPASFVAGSVYLVAPTLTIHLPGHLHLLISGALLPYVLLFSMLALAKTGRSRWIWTILAAITLTLTFIGHWSFVFIASLPLAAFILFYTDASRKDRAVSLVTILFLALLLTLPFALAANQARQATFAGAEDFSAETADSFSISAERLFMPSLFHPLWRDALTERFPVGGEHHFISIGYAALILAIVGLLRSRLRLTLPIVMLGLASLVLGLGLTLHLNGERVLLDVPETIDRLARAIWWAGAPALPPDQIAIPLPGLLLYLFLPFYSAMRVAARYTIPLMIAVGVLAGLGTKALLGIDKRWAYAVAAILGFFVLFEGLVTPYNEFTSADANTRTADIWLAAQAYPTPLIEYPDYIGKQAMVSQSKHGQPLVNGYMSILPNFLSESAAILGPHWPGEAALPLLREWDVKLMVVSGIRGAGPFQEEVLPQLIALDGLCLLQTFDDAYYGYDRTYIFRINEKGSDCQVERQVIPLESQ